MSSADFQFFAPMRFFKGADGDMRIAGVITTDNVDQQGERILQDGLDFHHFMTKGYFNDNHSNKTSDILGYPERVQFFEKGSQLPDGTKATANLHWAEGRLLPDYEPSKRIWTLGQSLAKAGGGRSLGFSVEGKIKRRTGRGQKIIAKAEVKNVAITNCPVNADTKLLTLAKSLQAAQNDLEGVDLLKSFIDQFGAPTVKYGSTYTWETGPSKVTLTLSKSDDIENDESGDEDRKAEKKIDKTLSMTPAGGTGQGAVLARESLETKLKNTSYSKSFSDKALDKIQSRLGVDTTTAERFLGLVERLHRRGLLS